MLFKMVSQRIESVTVFTFCVVVEVVVVLVVVVEVDCVLAVVAALDVGAFVAVV